MNRLYRSLNLGIRALRFDLAFSMTWMFELRLLVLVMQEPANWGVTFFYASVVGFGGGSIACMVTYYLVKYR